MVVGVVKAEAEPPPQALNTAVPTPVNVNCKNCRRSSEFSKVISKAGISFQYSFRQAGSIFSDVSMYNATGLFP